MPTVLPTGQREPGGVAEDGGRKLTGKHVLLILICFFGTVAAANFVMIRYATTTFSGEVAKKPYEQGLAFNKEIVAAREQEARGWKVDGKVKREAGKALVEISARDAAGAPLTGLRVEATLASPTDKKLDHPVKLDEAGGGVYRGATDVASGSWDLELKAGRDGARLFQSRNRVTLE